MTTPGSRKRPADEASLEEEEQRPSPYIPEEANDEPSLDEEEQVVPKEIKRAINPVGQPPEAGVIKRVYMENFMCHRKLKVDLCRNVNFIHGQNGSGKSAILAAIQICLGAGARRTHRAKNLKELIRKETVGSNPNASAKIRVTVLNGGGDGFKHDIYGDEITVERSISLRGGYNGYKLLDINGVEKSRNKRELDEMLDHLNIQVENPVAILDQEEAKKFLMGKAEDKYNFFMKATELERIDGLYASAQDHAEELAISSDKLRRNMDAKLDLVSQLKQKWEEHQQLEKLEEKLLDLNVNLGWSLYNMCKGKHDEAEQAFAACQEKTEKRQQDLAQAEAEANGPSDEENLKRERIEELNEEAKRQANLKRELEADLKRAENPQKSLERRKQQVRRELAEAKQESVRAKARLQEARDEALRKAGSAESEAARRSELLKKTEDQLASAQQKSPELQQSVSVALRSCEEMEPQVSQARQDSDAKLRQLNVAQGRAKDLSRSDGGSAALFGKNCQKMCTMVDRAKREGKFRGPVVGPIGAYIKVAAGKEEFASIAELALGSRNLDRFVVTNDHDRRHLQELRKRAGCFQDCGVFQVHNSARFEVPTAPANGIETVATALNISDDLVFNCLVDNRGIDQNALASSKKLSEDHLLQSDGNGKYSVKGNLKDVYFLPSGDRWMVRDGSISIVSNEQKMRQTIGVDMSAALAEAKQEEMQLAEELKELRAKHSRLSREEQACKDKWKQEKQHFKANVALVQRLTEQINEIKDEIESSANFTIDTTDLEEDVSSANQNIESIKETLDKIQQQIVDMAPNIQDLRNKLDEVTTRNERVMADMAAAQKDFSSYLQTQSQKHEILDKKRAKVKQAEEKLGQCQSKLDDTGRDLETSLMKARKLTYKKMQRIKNKEIENVSQLKPTEEDLEEIEIVTVAKEPKHFETRIARARQKIEKEKERRQLSTDDPAAAYEKYIRAKTDVEASQRQVEEINESLEQIGLDLKKRRKRYKSLQDHLSRMTDSKFDEILMLNKASGQIEFDHKNTSLNLVVQKDMNDTNSQTKDVKALSGGERSYTTMALLLALGESLETPFRILDEFDVFLDTQVRKLTIDALIFVAKRYRHRQFIFITPQDVSSVTPDSELKIVTLRAPERNQVAGGHSQQTINFESQ